MHVNGFGTSVKSCQYELRYLHYYQSAKLFFGVSERQKKNAIGEIRIKKNSNQKTNGRQPAGTAHILVLIAVNKCKV